MSVWSVMRGTSKRLCFMASMERSNSTLSGCFDPTLASGFCDFLLVQATVSASRNASSRTIKLRRIISTSAPQKLFHHGGTETRRKQVQKIPFSVTPRLRGGTDFTLAANLRSAPLPAASRRLLWELPCRIPHCPLLESLPRRGLLRQPSPGRRLHLLRCGKSSLSKREFPRAFSFYAAWRG